MAGSMIRKALFLVVSMALAALAGCSDKPTAVTPESKSPETQLTFAPLEGDTSSFRVHFYWNGYDDDGEVTQYRYALDADTLKPPSDWIATTAKDTTLLFLVDPIQEVKGHVFWVVSEDNDGNFDPTPAKRFFSAKTIPPTSRIIRGPDSPGTLIGPNFTFQWEGIDPDGGETGGAAPVDSFEYLLLQVGAVAEEGHPPLPPYNRQQDYVDSICQATGRSLLPPHDDWKWVGIRGTRKRFTNVTPGHYVFALRAVDIAGASEKLNRLTAYGPNIRDFNVTNKNPGPRLTINSSVLVSPLPDASGPDDIVRREIQIFQGETISFSWTASAENYGGEVVGYTYALDDTTTAEWGSINILKTAATFQPSVLTAGLHFLFVRVVDDGGLVTNAKVPLRIVHPTFQDPPSALNPPQVLWVDDFTSPQGLGAYANYPSDDVEDAWWRRVIRTPLAQNFGVIIEEWDTVRRGFTSIEGREVPKPEHLAPYRVVIWSVDFNNTGSAHTALWKTLVGGSYSELSGYLRAGGTLILTGFELGYNTTQPSTIIYQSLSRGMCATLEEGSFAFRLSYFPRNFMGVDAAVASDGALRSAGAKDFVEARVTPEGSAMGFATAQVDTGGAGTGAKWNSQAFQGDPEFALAPGLPSVDGWILQTFFGCQTQQGLFRKEKSGPIAVPILTYHGVPREIAMNGGPSPREGRIVGIATQAHDLGNVGGGSLITPGNARGAIGRMVFLGFPIYFMEDDQAYATIRAAFEYVNNSPTLPTYVP